MKLINKVSTSTRLFLERCCVPMYGMFYSGEEKLILKKFLYFCCGLLLGYTTYYFLLSKIPCPYYIRMFIVVSICLLVGLAMASSIQIRCVSLLTVPMYCGKSGRGVLKAIVFTYVIAGPISNLALNAREVVRVFACSSSLSYNLTKTRYALMRKPLLGALRDLEHHVGDVKDTWRSIREVSAPIVGEMEGEEEMNKTRMDTDYIDDLMGETRRSALIEEKYKINPEDNEQTANQKRYLKKMEYRCHDQISRSTAACLDNFSGAHDRCLEEMRSPAGHVLCWPLKLTIACNIMRAMGGDRICDSRRYINPGLGEGYVYLKKSTAKLKRNLDDVKLQYHVWESQEIEDIQDARVISKRVMHTFNDKDAALKTAITILDACFSLLYLRIFLAACKYHDNYLTKIRFDNVYVTGYFRMLDGRRFKKRKYILLPLKKMEKLRYMELFSTKHVTLERNHLVIHTLKLMLEVMTATTFVMLERLFYEALDAVRRHADEEDSRQGVHDLTVDVKGTGIVAAIIRSVVDGFRDRDTARAPISNVECLPSPHAMSTLFYFKIYGGYFWILVLIYFDSYTLRLSRIICSYFYPRREKERVLYLYNDLLKRRIKLQDTFRKSALRTVRARRLSAEDLLKWRLRFPHLLGWLSVFPAARNKCTICCETQPRSSKQACGAQWERCLNERCACVYCGECWRDVGARCLACEPALREVSDEDSLSQRLSGGD